MLAPDPRHETMPAYFRRLRAVEKRVDEIVAEHKAVAALVEHKLAPTTVPKPRTDELDALELARIAKLREAREVKHRADRLVQEHRIATGTAAFTSGDGAPMELGYVPSPADRLDYFKYAPKLEHRNAYGVPEE